jgi:copper resistance protein C
MSRATTWKGRTLLVYGVALLALTFAPGGLLAHSRLTKSEPAARQVVSQAPKELKLWFNEAVEPAFAKISITPADGRQIPLSSRGDSSDKKLLVVTMPDSVPAGPVVINYHVLSVDGHTIDDKFSFTVKPQ